MDQLALNFSARPPRMATHAENLRRVKGDIRPAIIEFFLARQVGDRFHVAELSNFVNDRHRCAPDSPRRIMSELAREGELDYVVVNRRNSLYQITKLPEREAA